MNRNIPSSETVKPWWWAKNRLGHSIKLRMVVMFLFLAAAMTLVFFTAAQKAFSLGWREAARPLLKDYVSRLAAEVSADAASPPSIQRARAITERLPLTVNISGPVVNWRSHPHQEVPHWHRDPESTGHIGNDKTWEMLVRRTTDDGHQIEFGVNEAVLERRPRLLGYALAALLLLTLCAWLYVRRLLQPLDAIGEGARRFGAGDFSQPIAQLSPNRRDELGELASTINTMGEDIRQMLDAKRALLLAISHELRSPLTRARLNTELLPETADLAPQRDALLRDLQEMGGLISDLLESERLAGRHAALLREPLALPALAQEVLIELQARYPGAVGVRLDFDPAFPLLALDAARMRLLLRNLLDNALRYSSQAPLAPEVHGSVGARYIALAVRDHGPGVPECDLHRLAEPFYRPDAARTRAQGGVGLGLHLCKLVTLAHGGTFSVVNAKPGLLVTVVLPLPL